MPPRNLTTDRSGSTATSAFPAESLSKYPHVITSADQRTSLYFIPSLDIIYLKELANLTGPLKCHAQTQRKGPTVMPPIAHNLAGNISSCTNAA